MTCYCKDCKFVNLRDFYGYALCEWPTDDRDAITGKVIYDIEKCKIRLMDEGESGCFGNRKWQPSWWMRVKMALRLV